MSDDRLTVCETRELLTESLSRAQDCAADLVREVSDRDATIARLQAEADVLSGRACAEEQRDGAGRCGACVVCLRAEIAWLKGQLAKHSPPPDGAPCSKCRGSGVSRLAPQRQRVLDAVRALGTASPSDVIRALGGVDTETAINRAANVCAWLASAGLLESLGRAGKRVMYRASLRPIEDALREAR